MTFSLKCSKQHWSRALGYLITSDELQIVSRISSMARRHKVCGLKPLNSMPIRNAQTA
ncbi:hypothetical protein GGD56_005689 [Rhizobium mongolense]|uniref:Transposase n=1 Tax=Rhizobium mongolense TaxID=57676 RepID=A0ABR6IV69_9HYPH|nr:hypothetical protein [Rhizobium mongolense]